jgi:hypothetical protein
MAKSVSPCPEWLAADGVVDIYSVSSHISHDFAPYIPYWRHNGYWLFDAPETIRTLAQEHAIDLGGTSVFYYEVHDQEFDETTRAWTDFEPEPSFPTAVVIPPEKALAGYDVVSFSRGTSPECSPLSCNRLAAEVETNSHCLLASLEETQDLLERGVFDRTEPGPFRVFAVYPVASS